MFKYSFENTGVHPSLATKLSQIVIKRDDLCENFNNLNLPQGVSAQASRDPTAIEEEKQRSFDGNSPIKNQDGFDAIDNDLALEDADDAFMAAKENPISVVDEVTKLVLDQLNCLEN